MISRKNMHRLFHFFFYASFTTLFGCNPKTPSATTGAFNDDISVYRVKAKSAPQLQEQENMPEIEEISSIPEEELPEPQLSINESINEKLILISQQNDKVKTTQGYRVLVYSGKNRTLATEAQKFLLKSMDEKVELSFEPPNYWVKVGNYLTKLDAHRTYKKLKEEFPRAIVIPDKIIIDRQHYLID